MRWILFNILFFGSCGYALRRGGPSERIAAIILALARAATVMVRSQRSDGFNTFQTGVFLVDLGEFVLLLALALGTKRWWPLWMTGLSAAAVVSHIVRLSPMVNSFAYYALIAFWMYPMLLLLIVATWRKGRRRAAPQGALS